MSSSKSAMVHRFLRSIFGYAERSDSANLPLFRQNVKERQKLMLEASLKSLENVVLTARSGTSNEARLPREEADLILQWVERTKEIKPRGQVDIAQAENPNDLLLENGDILRVSTKNGLVLVSGKVLSPTTLAFNEALGPEDYPQYRRLHSECLYLSHYCYSAP